MGMAIGRRALSRALRACLASIALMEWNEHRTIGRWWIMHSRRWAFALMITLIVIDAWLKRAEANSIEPARAIAVGQDRGVPSLDRASR